MNTKFKLFLTAVFAGALLNLSSGAVLAETMEGSHGMMEGSHGKMEENSSVAIKGFCPVCVMNGMKVKGSDHFVTEYNGKIYKFPSIEQQKMFLDDPEKYVQDLEAKFDALKDDESNKDKKMMEGSH